MARFLGGLLVFIVFLVFLENLVQLRSPSHFVASEKGSVTPFFLAQVRHLKKKLYLCILRVLVYIYPLHFYIIQWTQYYVLQ